MPNQARLRSVPTPESLDLEAGLEVKLERLIEEKLSKALSNLAITQPSNQTPDSKPAIQISS